MATDLTADPTAGTSGAEDEQAALFCYRHPTRETYIRCGRCERPICTGCAMLGPVGSRCKTCGKPAFDPLTSFSPFQLLAGGGLAIGGGFVGGLVGSSMGGLFGILVGFFAGGLLAESVMRVVGYKRGPIMVGLVMGGIAVGAVLALGYSLWPYLRYVPADQPGIEILFNLYGTGVLIFAAAAMAGAWTRIR
jgi:hypothetical protein